MKPDCREIKVWKNMCILEWVSYSLWIHNLIHINCCWLLKLWKDLTKLILICLHYVSCTFYLSPLGLHFSSCFKLQADRSCDFPSWYLNTRESFIHWSPITSGISSSLFSIQGEGSIPSKVTFGELQILYLFILSRASSSFPGHIPRFIEQRQLGVQQNKVPSARKIYLL